ncbi:hypothetical protein ABGI61_10075 [Rheinheimera sp. FR7-31]|uniref:hypothetical protein n=1 Tax=Rheinheimera fenheensis TaxID=3152295 RepID=UPI00325F0796
MVTLSDVLSVSQSYPQWLQQQTDTALLQTCFNDGSVVVFSLLTHETSIAGSAEVESVQTEAKPT